MVQSSKRIAQKAGDHAFCPFKNLQLLVIVNSTRKRGTVEYGDLVGGRVNPYFLLTQVITL